MHSNWNNIGVITNCEITMLKLYKYYHVVLMQGQIYFSSIPTNRFIGTFVLYDTLCLVFSCPGRLELMQCFHVRAVATWQGHWD